MKQAGPGARRHGRRAQPARRHLRLGRRVLRPDAGQPAGRRPGQRRARSRDAFNHWDDIDVHFHGHDDHAPAATASAASAASACSTSCRSAARSSACELRVRDARCEDDAAYRRRRPDHRRATASTAASAASYADAFQPDIDAAQLPLRLARHAQAVRRLHLRLRGDRARLVPGARLPVRRRHLDLHRRDAASDVWRGAGLDRMEPGGGDRRSASSCSRSTSTATALMSQRARTCAARRWLNFPRVVCEQLVHQRRTPSC